MYVLKHIYMLPYCLLEAGSCGESLEFLCCSHLSFPPLMEKSERTGDSWRRILQASANSPDVWQEPSTCSLRAKVTLEFGKLYSELELSLHTWTRKG
jgi:hypothetical protein